jgi:hypothetical protein
VKLHGAFTINDRVYAAGDEVPWWTIYPLFLVHMAAFGSAGFVLAYAPGAESAQGIAFLFSGFAILCYLPFYDLMFGRDGLKWMFINAGLGLFGIVTQIDWILSLFGRTITDYPLQNHVIPIIYFVMYTFLLRHAVLDLAGVREDEERRPKVEVGYIVGSVAFYLVMHLVESGIG